jgi:hypothetical protein
MSAPRALPLAIFVVAARCQEHMGAVHPGELHAEAGDAAGAEDRDRLAGLDAPGLDQRVPRRQRGAG